MRSRRQAGETTHGSGKGMKSFLAHNTTHFSTGRLATSLLSSIKAIQIRCLAGSTSCIVTTSGERGTSRYWNRIFAATCSDTNGSAITAAHRGELLVEVASVGAASGFGRCTRGKLKERALLLALFEEVRREHGDRAFCGFRLKETCLWDLLVRFNKTLFRLLGVFLMRLKQFLLSMVFIDDLLERFGVAEFEH
jgi:hypothetical protein